MAKIKLTLPVTGSGGESGGVTNLSYTASPTQGIINSDTGTDATIPLADGTNAGLLEPSKYTILENTSGTNTGDQDLSGKQDDLVSGTNIKTIEGQSLLGSGNIDLAKSDVGLSNVDNTSDSNKPISTATQTALDSKADLGNAFTVGRIPFTSSTSAISDSSKLLWNNTNSSLEVNGNAPRFTLKNNLNNLSTYFTNNTNGALFLKNHQDKTLAAFNNPVWSTDQPQMSIGNVSSIPTESQLYVYGGKNGANIDARGSATVDEANIDLEGNDWETAPNSLGFSYFGSSATAFGTMMGYAKNKLGVIRFQDTNYAIINSDKSTGVSPIRFGINQIEIGNVNDKGFSYQSDFSSENISNPRWLTDKAYVDTKIPLSEKGATNGVATLGSDGKVLNSQIPALTTANIPDSAEKRYQTDNQKLFNDATSSIQTQINGKENSFAKNTAFNKNFGTTAGTVIEGGTLGSNAYSSTAYLPLSGGTISGNVNVTGTFNGVSGTFSSKLSTVGVTSVIESNGGFNTVSSNVNTLNTSYTITNSAAAKTVAFTAGKSGISQDGFGFNNVTDNTYPIWVEADGSISLNSNTTVTGSVTATSFNGSATLTGTPTAPTAAVGTNTTQIATTAFVQGIRPYKVYTALISQTGTNAPTAIVLENTIGAIVWSRTVIGGYFATLSGAFTTDKTSVLITNGSANSTYIHGAQVSTSNVNVITLADGQIDKATIEIRVYN